MTPAGKDLRELRARIPTDHGLTVFDAETQDTSYGTLVVDGLPLIFDTHRKDGRYVSTAEILTEVRRPVRIAAERVAAFTRNAARRGLLALPYTACFFKGNLHVYMYSGAVRGFDLTAIGDSVASAEGALESKVRRVWRTIPPEVLRAQRDLLAGNRAARYDADLAVLRRRRRNDAGAGHRSDD